MAIAKQISQEIFEGEESCRYAEQIIKQAKADKILVVCGSAFRRSALPEIFAENNMDYVIYNGFRPNPTYENVLEGLKVFRENHCDFLISVGGGSAIDVAKCIKAYADMDICDEYTDREITDSKIPHLAVPTTAGTGSESTQFAVLYYKGEKKSVSAGCLLPEYVILDPSFLSTLPDYQKASTLIDALCQATESYWAKKATKESRNYAEEAITLILRYAKPYIQANGNLVEIFHGANLAGRAINLTQTTLAHAMSYKLTSFYGIAHGHAVAVCMPYVWEYLASHTDCLIEGVNQEELEQTLARLNELYCCQNTKETIAFLKGMLVDYGLSAPEIKEEEIEILAGSVNAQRMRNFPAVVERADLEALYRRILTESDQQSVPNQFLYHVVSDLRLSDEHLSENQPYTCGFEVRESKTERRIKAAAMLLDAVWAYGRSSEEDGHRLKKIISELSISLNGYVLKNEVDVINYKNAAEGMKEFKLPFLAEETQDVQDMQQKYGVSYAHACVLYQMQRVEDAFKQNDAKIADVFGVRDIETNIKILQGMLCQYGLLPGEPFDALEARRMALYWEYVKVRFYDRKFHKYLTRLRKVQLEMMDEIARICDKHHLTYVLNYGSLLGAVRHGGFIPWDDDLDVCMPREDYEKFLKIGSRELQKGCYIYHSGEYKDCWSSIMKVMKKDTVFVRRQYNFGEEDGHRIFVDIWPLDNVRWPEEKPVRRMKKKKRLLTAMLRLKVQARNGVPLGKKQKLKLFLGKPFSEQWIIQKRRQVVTQWRDLETDYWLSGGVYGYVKEIMPKSWYIPTVKMSFEGHEYQFPGKYEEVLKHLYGNYMQIPPIDKRYTHAPFKVQMEKDGEVLYFNEMHYRKGKK